MFDLIFFITLLLFFSIATFFDIKYRKIPNKFLLISLILFSILFLIKLIFNFSFSLLFNTLLSFLLTALIGYLLWEFGVIAGGDLKFIVVLSILAPLNLSPFNHVPLYTFFKLPIFPLVLLFSSFVVFIPFIFSLAIVNIFLSKKITLLKNLFFTKNNIFSLFLSSLFLFLFSSFLSLFDIFLNNAIIILSSILFFLFVFFFKKLSKKIYLFLISFGYFLLIICSLIFKKQLLPLKDFFIIFITVFIFSFFLFLIKFIILHILRNKIKIKNLEEGMVLSKNYYYDFNLKKLEVIDLNFSTHLKMLLNNTYFKNLKIDSKKAGGLTKEDIVFLNSMCDQNLIEDSVEVKSTLPFIPVIFITFIFLNIIF